MDRQLFFRLYRVGLALLVLFGLGVLIVDLIQLGRFNPVNYFSFFTVQSNLIGVAAFLLAARAGAMRSHRLELLRGASVVYLTVTFVVFALLLRGTDVDTTLAWVDFIVHTVFPIVVLLDWLIDPPMRRVSAKQALVWLAYPLAWLGYTLIRGALTGWYPYPFLDPANGGYGSVATYVVAILAFGLAVVALVALAGNLARRLRGAHAGAEQAAT